MPGTPRFHRRRCRGIGGKLKRSSRLRLAGRVCLHLGIDDPEQWLHEASSRKVAFWEAFFRVEPFGCDWERDAIKSTLLSCLMMTVAATAGGKGKPQKLEDFMPAIWEGARKSNVPNEESLDSFQQWANRYGK